jgi:hypothetical protein
LTLLTVPVKLSHVKSSTSADVEEWHEEQLMIDPPQVGSSEPWQTVVEQVPSSTCVAPALFQFTPPAVFAVST